MKTKFLSVFFLLLLGSNQIFADNTLVLRSNNFSATRPGYIDKATLVIEPHGVYTENSLYLEYSDHRQFYNDTRIEIIHRFELLQGAVINDLWLWIGDSVVKAIMLDTWKAKSIYDSIVHTRKDPALLTKKGNQYELRIFPMVTGNFRKIKISYMTPILWDGNNVKLELPLKMLLANNNQKKPLKVLFRSREGSDYNPEFLENTTLDFLRRIDTLGASYKLLFIDDITNYNSLTLQHQFYSMNGAFLQSDLASDNLHYFQVSLQLKDIFKLSIDSLSKKVMVGLDLSGRYKDLNSLIPELKRILQNTLKPQDEFNIIISGAGKTKKISENWIKNSPENIENIINKFQYSSFADSIRMNQKLKIIFSDLDAQRQWGLNTFNEVADVVTLSDAPLAFEYLSGKNIIASYREGNYEIYNIEQLNLMKSYLDSFLFNGGRYVHFYNNDNPVRVVSKYIKGLKVIGKSHADERLFRNDSGNIGINFPEIFYHNPYYYSFSDPDVKVELKDKNGNACVISKKIGKGIVIISGLTSIDNDEDLKAIISTPILGLTTSNSYPNQLKELLENIRTEYQSNEFADAIVISNSDTINKVGEIDLWVADYLNKFNNKKPRFTTINILEDRLISFPWITFNDVKYLGSGYLENVLSSQTNGKHYELDLGNWNYIDATLQNYNYPFPTEYSVLASGDNDTLAIQEFREIILKPASSYNPKFYVGSTKAKTNLSFMIKAKFNSSDSLLTEILNFPLSVDSRKETVIPSILGNEKILEFFKKNPIDTAIIVNTAIKYNLLCDYTALLALEPNDTIHFMKNFLDESMLNVEDEFEIDSLIVSAYPNPFNAETRIMVNVKEPSRVSISVYNILGELVSRIAENEDLTGKKLFSWNGKAEGNLNTASGIYFTRIEIVNSSTNQKKVKTIKLMMLK